MGETIGIFTITEVMPYRDDYGHTLYKGICNCCGYERIARYIDFKITSKCSHVRADGKIHSYDVKWNNRRLRKIFAGMKQRCYNKNERSYKWYGAKGIKVCNEWLDNPELFEKWAIENGYKDNLTIDRIDENKDYEPSNCRWKTLEQNARYKSTTSMIEVDSEKHTGREWAEILGLGTNRINTYIRDYGLDNTVEFIRRYIKNPLLSQCKRGKKSIYSLYMESN